LRHGSIGGSYVFDHEFVFGTVFFVNKEKIHLHRIS
jgi:hypothetical protein